MSKAATRIYCRVCTQPIQPGRIKCALCNTAVPESDLAAVGELILPKSPASASRMSTRASPNMSTKSASGFTSPATPVPHQLGKTDSNRASPKLDRSQQYAPAKAPGAPWQADMLQPLNVMGQHPDDMHGQPEVRLLLQMSRHSIVAPHRQLLHCWKQVAFIVVHHNDVKDSNTVTKDDLQYVAAREALMKGWRNKYLIASVTMGLALLLGSVAASGRLMRIMQFAQEC